MTSKPVLIYRWIVFLLAGFFCIRTLFLSDFSEFGGPFRYLTIWALFLSFFAASRMMALMEGRSEKRWDGFVAMTSVINAMVVFLYWRLFLADPMSVTRDGELGEFYLELYLHGLGPLLQWIDAIFIHKSFRKIPAAIAWLAGVITLYLTWGETLVSWNNDKPEGSVTSGIPYPFLNNMELSDRLIFYGANMVIALVLLMIFAGIAWLVRRRSPAPVAP
ncbi:FAR-17a/AIG1-like protein [Cognatiyoonia sediminum]|uniref:FAR-17a/AIG1-like protein n=1 Tax=Cognatiyoonia sediminum TaxID=1508389 RepID=A0A1M5Q6F2_9RHOB|nr:hypothetical protein [Cognatiyoonia sediminum]SHH09837.1 FAR-17a/AIG1-like protein [Cognatiyoonia sediminum]